MKFVVCLLVLLPFAYCASIDGRLDERWLLPNVTLHDFLTRFHVLDLLKSALGSDTSLHACESVCPKAVASIPGASSVSGQLCHLACTELQKAIQG